MDKIRKKNVKRIVSMVCIVALVLFLAVMPLLAKQNTQDDGPKASILTGTVSAGSIDTALMGGGTLAEDDAVTISVPAEVKLTKFLVTNGQTVTKGTPIAEVDRVTVMTAITQVQETLEYLSEAIEDAADATTIEYVTALAGGTVKAIYAQEGESVQNVMLEHGALAVLSLDGLMAVDLETESALAAGSPVLVTLSDGSEVDGKIVRNLAGEMTVTVEDDDYAVGDKVKITSTDGTFIGYGELYIYSPWNATAYAGTVSNIYVAEGNTLSAGKIMIKLTDVGYSAAYRQLIAQRQEYEDLMQELFQMYQTEIITAPCDGVVSGVDEESPYLLASAGNEGWVVRLLSFFGGKTHDGFVACAAKVTEVTEQGMTLLMDPRQHNIEDLSALCKVSADVSAMDTVWTYSGETTVYTQTENGLLQKKGYAEAGDILLIVGDEDRVHWFVALDETETALQQTAAEIESGNSYLALLADDGTESDEQTGGDQTGGDQTGGDQTGGDQTGGDQTGGDQTGGDQTGGDQTGGDQTGGDQTGGDQTGGDQTGGDQTSGDQTGGDQTGGDQTSGDQTGGDQTGGDQTDGDQTGGDQTGGDQTGGDQTGGDQTSGDQTGVDQTDDDDQGSTSGTESVQTYLGYIAQVVEIANGSMKVKQTAYSYNVTDLNNLPSVTVDTNALTQDATYTDGQITESTAAVGDYLLIIVAQDSALKMVKKLDPPSAGGQEATTPTTPTTPSGSGGTSAPGVSAPSGGSWGGMSGGVQQETVFELYDLEMVDIAAVTPQDAMTLEITVDELDVRLLQIGMAAQVKIDALGGEKHDAVISDIGNTGTGNGGSSKFTVELTMERGENMLAGMNATATIVLTSTGDVLTVPAKALVENGNQTVVYTGYDEEAETLSDPVTVTVGCSDGENVEILEGLADGQTYYYAYYDTLEISAAPDFSRGFFG